jgi:hypothetical protein
VDPLGTKGGVDRGRPLSRLVAPTVTVQPIELVLQGSPLGVGLREVEGPPVHVARLVIAAGAL